MASSAASSSHSTRSAAPVAPSARRIRLCGRTADNEQYSDPPTLEELRNIFRGLRDALDDECRAASAAVVTLGAGTRLAVVSTGCQYRFDIAAPLDASAGDPVLVRLGHREFEAMVVACRDREIEVTLADDVGSVVSPGAELLLDAPWLLTRLRQRVSEAFEVGLTTPSLFNLPNALRTLGVGEIAVAETGPTPVYEDTKRPLNEAQTRAVEVAFRSPLSLIVAPPGTGKTYTLGALVEACYHAGWRVLVTAPSNAAVDLQMMQVCARLSNEPGFARADVLRVGADAGEDLRASFGADVVLDEVIARLRPKLQERLERRQHAVDALAGELNAARQTSASDTDGRVQTLRRRLAGARAELRQVRQEVREYSRLLVSGARIVGATLARTYLDPDLRGYDVVVIDEASMAQGPAVFVAAGLARRHVIIAGDPFQLAAPVRANGPNRHWLATDVFERLDAISAIRNEEDVPYLTELTEQRRSAEEICDLLRSVWYGPSLRTARDVRERERERHNVIFGTHALCFVDTSSLNPRAYHPYRRTFANDQHADLIADLIAFIDSAGELPPSGRAGGEILVLSHYRGQVANIRRRLGAQYRARGVSVRTVHRAQGAEATTVIVDLTLSSFQPTSVSSVMTAVRPMEDGSRLLATAVSRARSRLVVVGDFEWIERAVDPATVLGRMYSHLLQHGRRVPIHEFRDGRSAPPLRVMR